MDWWVGRGGVLGEGGREEEGEGEGCVWVGGGGVGGGGRKGADTDGRTDDTESIAHELRASLV